MYNQLPISFHLSLLVPTPSPKLLVRSSTHDSSSLHELILKVTCQELVSTNYVCVHIMACNRYCLTIIIIDVTVYTPVTAVFALCYGSRCCCSGFVKLILHSWVIVRVSVLRITVITLLHFTSLHILYSAPHHNTPHHTSYILPHFTYITVYHTTPHYTSYTQNRLRHHSLSNRSITINSSLSHAGCPCATL